MLHFALSLVAAVPLVTFDGTPATTYKFVELNDPVMGGQSSGTWNVSSSGYGSMNGKVMNVPSLSAPGFIKASADGDFADASSAYGGYLILTLRSTTTQTYAGFRVSFASGTESPSYACSGGGSIPLSRGCYKAHFALPASAANDFVEIRVPFTDFTDLWNPATGEPTTTCAESADACPTAKRLAGIKRIELWAEGVDGAVALDVKSIAAEPAPKRRSAPLAASSVSTRPPAEYDTCSAAVQPNLQYGISGRKTPDVPVPVNPLESLAEAVCCDIRTILYAEPQFLYEAPDVQLFSHLPADGTPTTFYDSVCGVPLFRAPVERSLDDFEADTTEHGWPSFRTAEVVDGNVLTNTTSGFVTSVCGTHLGTYLPDEAGPRWCIDLSCIAGNSA